MYHVIQKAVHQLRAGEVVDERGLVAYVVRGLPDPSLLAHNDPRSYLRDEMTTSHNVHDDPTSYRLVEIPVEAGEDGRLVPASLLEAGFSVLERAADTVSEKLRPLVKHSREIEKLRSKLEIEEYTLHRLKDLRRTRLNPELPVASASQMACDLDSTSTSAGATNLAESHVVANVVDATAEAVARAYLQKMGPSFLSRLVNELNRCVPAWKSQLKAKASAWIVAPERQCKFRLEKKEGMEPVVSLALQITKRTTPSASNDRSHQAPMTPKSSDSQREETYYGSQPPLILTFITASNQELKKFRGISGAIASMRECFSSPYAPISHILAKGGMMSLAQLSKRIDAELDLGQFAGGSGQQRVVKWALLDAYLQQFPDHFEISDLGISPSADDVSPGKADGSARFVRIRVGSPRRHTPMADGHEVGEGAATTVASTSGGTHTAPPSAPLLMQPPPLRLLRLLRPSAPPPLHLLHLLHLLHMPFCGCLPPPPPPTRLPLLTVPPPPPPPLLPPPTPPPPLHPPAPPASSVPSTRFDRPTPPVPLPVPPPALAEATEANRSAESDAGMRSAPAASPSVCASSSTSKPTPASPSAPAPGAPPPEEPPEEPPAPPSAAELNANEKIFYFLTKNFAPSESAVSTPEVVFEQRKAMRDAGLDKLRKARHLDSPHAYVLGLIQRAGVDGIGILALKMSSWRLRGHFCIARSSRSTSPTMWLPFRSTSESRRRTTRT